MGSLRRGEQQEALGPAVVRRGVASFASRLHLTVHLGLVLVVAGCARSAPIADSGDAAAGASFELVDSAIPPEIAPNEPDAAERVIRYPFVPLTAREGRVIRLREDLVIEEQPGNRDYDFERATALVVDEEGRLYVHDSGRYRVIVYTPDGTFVGAYGGAGEMAPFRRGWIALVGGRLAISTGTKVTVWSRAGEHLDDRSLMRHAFSGDVQGTVDGALVGSFVAQDRNLDRWYSVEKRYLDSDESFTYWAVRFTERRTTRPQARPDFAATRRGEVYLTRGDRYVVHAFDGDGAPRWILHVDRPDGPQTDTTGVPPPALSSRRAGPGSGHAVRADDHGNLYVFPYVGDDWQREQVPVDVYAPDGERLFAGFMKAVSWTQAMGDAIYGIENDERTGRQRVVRYRLQTPYLEGASR